VSVAQASPEGGPDLASSESKESESGEAGMPGPSSDATLEDHTRQSGVSTESSKTRQDEVSEEVSEASETSKLSEPVRADSTDIPAGVSGGSTPASTTELEGSSEEVKDETQSQPESHEKSKDANAQERQLLESNPGDQIVPPGEHEPSAASSPEEKTETENTPVTESAGEESSPDVETGGEAASESASAENAGHADAFKSDANEDLKSSTQETGGQFKEQGRLQPPAETLSPTIVSVPPEQPSSKSSTGSGGGRKKTVTNTLFQLPGLRISRSTSATAADKAPKREGSFSKANHEKVEPPKQPDNHDESSKEKMSQGNEVLLHRIQKLEKELEESQSLVRQLQQHHDKDEQDAAAQDSLLVDLQTNLQTQMSQRAEAEDKLRRATDAAKMYKEKLTALETESKEKMEQLEKTLAKVTQSKSDMESELESARKERDDAVQKEGTMALRLNTLIKKDAEEKNTVQYYEEHA